MEQQVRFIASKVYDAEGNWKGRPDHKVTINGELHDWHKLVKKYDIEVPSQSKTKKQVNTNADMGQTLRPSHTEEHGTGDSEE
jgi:hypothetical protein